MEFSFRDILIIISVVVIIAIYLNGRRKIHVDGKNPIKLKSDKVETSIEDDVARNFDREGFDQLGVGVPKPVVLDNSVPEPSDEELEVITSNNPPPVSDEELMEQAPTLQEIEVLERDFSPSNDDLEPIAKSDNKNQQSLDASMLDATSVMPKTALENTLESQHAIAENAEAVSDAEQNVQAMNTPAPVAEQSFEEVPAVADSVSAEPVSTSQARSATAEPAKVAADQSVAQHAAATKDVAVTAKPAKVTLEPIYKEPVYKEPVFESKPAAPEPEMPSMSALDDDDIAANNSAVATEPKVQNAKGAVKAAAKAKATTSTAKPTKAKKAVKRNQMEMDFDTVERGEKVELEQEVLALSVVMPEQQAISGAALLPCFLTLGLKFGEMNIFHRHQDNAGNGKITFSVANMVNPGTFDLDNMEQFSTRGITMFMTLPNANDPQKVFKQMLSAAKQIADEFGGQVLDGQRSVMTRQTEQHYMSKIREFDRRARLAGY
ncbi:cell division protein ZipA [Thalassotalea sp. Y01]|uniref:cell division protein ZipA n=1 Tax=Thalassotalea sp. Y01 TaxID=2729613 RepID=UPI00200710C1|nr:cell division protein ZipA [Thalassotalea sp. Y01]